MRHAYQDYLSAMCAAIATHAYSGKCFDALHAASASRLPHPLPPGVCRHRMCARTCRRAAVARSVDEAAAEGPEEEEAAPAAAHAEDVARLLGAGEEAGTPSQSVGSCSSDEPAGDEGESAGESEQEEESGDEDAA